MLVWTCVPLHCRGALDTGGKRFRQHCFIRRVRFQYGSLSVFLRFSRIMRRARSSPRAGCRWRIAAASFVRGGSGAARRQPMPCRIVRTWEANGGSGGPGRRHGPSFAWSVSYVLSREPCFQIPRRRNRLRSRLRRRPPCPVLRNSPAATCRTAPDRQLRNSSPEGIRQIVDRRRLRHVRIFIRTFRSL